MVAAREVGAPDRALEKHVADLRQAIGRAEEHDVTGRVARAVQDIQLDVTETHLVAGLEPAVGLEALDPGETEHPALLRHADDPETVLLVRPLDRYPGTRGECRDAPGMVDVAMGDEDLLDAQALALQCCQDAVDVTTRVDHRGAPGFLAPEYGAVLLERGDGDDDVAHGGIPDLRTAPIIACRSGSRRQAAFPERDSSASQRSSRASSSSLIAASRSEANCAALASRW